MKLPWFSGIFTERNVTHDRLVYSYFNFFFFLGGGGVSFLAANTLWKQIKYWETNETQHLEECTLLFYISNKNDTCKPPSMSGPVQTYPGLFSFRLKDVSVQSVGVLGKTDNRWKNLLARAIRARSTMSQRLFQGNFKTIAIVVYLD